jgi:hypothetical protein
MDSAYIKSKFFAKDNIITIYNNLYNKKFSKNINIEDKKKIISLIIENMKLVYKNIDHNKVNNNNIQNIFDQFNNHSLEESLKEINKTDEYNKYTSQKSPVVHNNIKNNKTLERNFAVCSNYNKNNIMERPTTSKLSHEEKIDGDAISRLKSSRENIENNKIPELPDFLKSKSFVKKDSKNNEDLSPPPRINNEFFAKTSNDSTLFPIDNFGKLLIDENIHNDNIDNLSFDDRLKKLKEDRNM